MSNNFKSNLNLNSKNVVGFKSFIKNKFNRNIINNNNSNNIKNKSIKNKDKNMKKNRSLYQINNILYHDEILPKQNNEIISKNNNNFKKLNIEHKKTKLCLT